MVINRVLSRMIKPSMAAILACWICLWVLKPTKLWKESWRKAEDRVAKSFLGDFGLDVLVFCYPVMRLAILGYIYQHLDAQSRIRRAIRIRNQQRSVVAWIRLLSNPALVRSPLGRVSWGELLGVLLFGSLVIWTMAKYVSDDLHTLASLKQSISSSRFAGGSFNSSSNSQRWGFRLRSKSYGRISRKILQKKLAALQWERPQS